MLPQLEIKYQHRAHLILWFELKEKLYFNQTSLTLWVGLVTSPTRKRKSLTWIKFDTLDQSFVKIKLLRATRHWDSVPVLCIASDAMTTCMHVFYLQQMYPSFLDMIAKSDHPVWLAQGFWPRWMQTLDGCLPLKIHPQMVKLLSYYYFQNALFILWS